MLLNALALAPFLLASFSAALSPSLDSRGKVGDALKGAEDAFLQAAPLPAGRAGGATQAGNATHASGKVAASGEKGATPADSADTATSSVTSSGDSGSTRADSAESAALTVAASSKAKGRPSRRATTGWVGMAQAQALSDA